MLGVARKLTYAEAHEDDGVHRDFLGMTSKVCCNPAVQEWQRAPNSVSHEIAREKTCFVSSWEPSHQSTTNQGGNNQCDDGNSSSIESASPPCR